MSKGFYVTRGRVLLKTIDEFKEDDIFLPDKRKSAYFEVIQVGDPDPIYTPDYESGDQVILPFGIGKDITIEGEQYVIAFQHQVLATKKKVSG